ncbi:MAG TPA: ComF family protein [Rhodothermales bacterium]
MSKGINGVWRRRLARALVHAGAGLADVLYPPRCVGCGNGIRANEQPLCKPCMASLERVDAGELAIHVRTNVPAFAAESVFALWMFDKGGALQRAQHLLKYGQRPAFGRVLGEAITAGWRGFCDAVPDLIVPIPLHRTRYLERGYNQSLALAEGIGRALGVPVRAHAIRRRQATKRQTGLNREARQANVAGAFVAVPEYVAGRKLILVDDVITTGATASAAVDALKTSGAERVDFVALAHART